jgi:hypothetical protein
VQFNSMPTGSAPTNTTIQFDLWHNLTPEGAVVDIQKLQRTGDVVRSTADIVVDGDIRNPAGWTRIINTDGDIRSGSDDAWIETNALDLEATRGDVGSDATARLNLLLVQSVNRGALPAASDDTLRPIRLTVAAGGDSYLRIQSVDRVAVTAGATTVPTTPLAVTIAAMMPISAIRPVLISSARVAAMGRKKAR